MEAGASVALLKHRQRATSVFPKMTNLSEVPKGIICSFNSSPLQQLQTEH